jgi:HK97 family phage prohead protease
MSDTTTAEVRDYATVLELRETQAVGKPYRYLEGRAVPYDVFADVGWYLEQHRAGSFKRSTTGRSGKNLPLLLFHDNTAFPIGHAEQWQHDAEAMRGVWQLNDSARAQEAARMAENGDLLGLSVGFQDATRPLWEGLDGFDPDDPANKPRVTRLESRLVEVSLTPTPAFTGAAVTMVRTRARPPAPRRRDADRWRDMVEELRSR